MASSFFFGGRQYITPTVMSVVNDQAMAPTQPRVGNTLCLIGQSEGGQPQVPLLFSDPATALSVLQSGPLCDATVRAFAPSALTGAPGTVMSVRVGAATRSTITLLDGSAVAIAVLTSTQYGLNANSTTVKIASGSISGKAVTIGYGQNFATQDNIGRTAFTVQYSGGQATASMTISNSTLTLFAPNATPVATIALSSYPTVGALVNVINTTASFAATVVGASGTTPSLNGLDPVSAVDVKTSLYSAKADIQAIIDWLNSAADPYVTAVRTLGAGLVPANIGTTYMTGGTSPAPITGDWTTALSMLQTQDVQWMVPLIGDASIHAAVDAHVQFMSSAGRKERRALVGPVSGTTLSAVEALPLAINSDRTSICYPGYYAFNAQGVRTLYDPFMTAALIGAGFAALNPGDAMTNKPITIQGLELAVKDPVDTDALIQFGVLAVKQEPSGFKVVRSISSWTTNNNFNRVEQSCGAATDFVTRNVRLALEQYKGGRASPQTLGSAFNTTETALQILAKPQPAGPGVIVGNAASPAYKNINVSIVGDAMMVNFECSPVIPLNFIPVTVAITPFSGTLTST